MIYIHLIYYVLDILLLLYFAYQFFSLDKKSIKLFSWFFTLIIASIHFYIQISFNNQYIFLINFLLYCLILKSIHKLFNYIDILFIFIYLIISQIIIYFFSYFIIFFYNYNIVLINSHASLMILSISIMMIIRFYVMDSILKPLSNSLKNFTKSQYTLILAFHVIILFINQMVIQYQGKYANEIYTMGSFIYFIIIFIYIFFLAYILLQNKYSESLLKHLYYEKQLNYLKTLSLSNAIYQNNYHDIFALLLKLRENEKISNSTNIIDEYINKHHPLQRFISKDHTLNVVINSYINLPEYQLVQIIDRIIEFIEINDLDLMVLFNELFSQIKNIQVSLKLVSENSLFIFIDHTIVETNEIKEIIDKYQGLFEIKDNHTIIILYYTDLHHKSTVVS